MLDLHELADYFAQGAFWIKGVYETEIKPGTYKGHSRANPTPYPALYSR